MANVLKGDLSRQRRLNLKQSTISIATMRQMCQAGWDHLQELCLSGTGLSSAVIQAIAPGSWPSLESLELYRVELDQASMAHLASMPWPKLRRLCFTDTTLDKTACDYLPHMLPNLRALRMEQANPSRSGTSSVSADSWVLSLLIHCSTGSLSHVSESTWARSTGRLTLSSSNANMPPLVVQQLIGDCWSKLRTLELPYVSTDMTTMTCLTNRSYSRLEFLDICGYAIDKAGL